MIIGFWSKTGNFLKSLHGEVVVWCRDRSLFGSFIRISLLIWFVYIFVNHLLDDNYQSIFGYLNLGIHELGHYLFALFGEFFGIAGGSILQCLLPLVSIPMFYRNSDFFGIAFCFGWLSTNLFYVATYVADARTMALPLVRPGGGTVIHDWNYLLSRMGMLEWDNSFAFFLRCTATISMIFFLVSGTYLVYLMFALRQQK